MLLVLFFQGPISATLSLKDGFQTPELFLEMPRGSQLLCPTTSPQPLSRGCGNMFRVQLGSESELLLSRPSLQDEAEAISLKCHLNVHTYWASHFLSSLLHSPKVLTPMNASIKKITSRIQILASWFASGESGLTHDG